MYEKIEAVANRFDELSEKLCDPTVATNAEVYTAVMKEYRSLEPLVTAYRRFQQTGKELDEAKEMLKDSADDTEMAALLNEEISRAEQELEELSENPAAAEGRNRRTGRHRGDPPVRRRRGKRAVCGGAVQNVQYVCGEKRLWLRGAERQRNGAGRL